MTEFDFDGGWADSAPGWLTLLGAGEPNRERLLDSVMLELCGDVRGTRALDIGCGEGRFARMLAARGSAAVGLDITEAFLHAARDAAGAPGRYVRGDAHRCPLPTAFSNWR